VKKSLGLEEKTAKDRSLENNIIYKLEEYPAEKSQDRGRC
jgi:hypothetical protein